MVQAKQLSKIQVYTTFFLIPIWHLIWNISDNSLYYYIMLQYITNFESQILLLYIPVFANIGGHSEDIVYGIKMMSR